MFLNLLDSDEKRAFAALAERMIEADGIVVGSEASALAALKGEMGLAPGDEIAGGVDELAGVFSSRRSKVAALLELIGLGYSDTSFGVGEQSLVREAAAVMGIADDDLADLESWVRRHVALIKEALILMRD